MVAKWRALVDFSGSLMPKKYGDLPFIFTLHEEADENNIYAIRRQFTTP